MDAWPITRKDLLILSRDRRALVTLLTMPLVIVAILGLSTGQLLGHRDRSAVLRIALADEDHGEVAAQLVRALRRHPAVEVQVVTDRAAAHDRVSDGSSVAAVIIGPQFAQRTGAIEPRDLLKPEQGRLAEGLVAVDIEIYARPAFKVSAAIVEQLVYGEMVRALLPAIAARDPLLRGFLTSGPEKEEHHVDAGASRSAARSADTRGTGSYGSAVYQVLVPSYAVMFAFFLVTIMARSFIAERESGTLLRLRIAPVSPSALLVGKTVPFLCVSLIQGAFLLLFGRVLFGMSFGPRPWLLVPVVAATALAATGLGLLVSTVVRSDAQVAAYGNLVVITLAGISGCFMPRDWLPDLMRQISLVTPHAWALIAYDELLTNPQPHAAWVWQCCAVLTGFAAAFFVLGSWRFRSAQ
ncbi:MAG TPA: ABC transporter permease [Phycisphaerae bacterium]|jgi:ABC-2 type transport system permease protein